jgi:hypothetical protein
VRTQIRHELGRWLLNCDKWQQLTKQKRELVNPSTKLSLPTFLILKTNSFTPKNYLCNNTHPRYYITTIVSSTSSLLTLSFSFAWSPFYMYNNLFRYHLSSFFTFFSQYFHFSTFQGWFWFLGWSLSLHNLYVCFSKLWKIFF